MEPSPHHQESSSPPRLLPSPTSHSVTTTTSSSSSNTNSSPRTAANPSGLGPHQHQHHHHHPPHPPPQQPSPKPLTRSEPANPYPTTFVQADTSSFKQVVQMLTGSPTTTASAAPKPDPTPPSASKIHNIPPIKSMPKKSGSGSGFKLYERRNSLKNFKINPLVPFSAQAGPGFSPRKPEILSPSILDFPSLVLSPVTPLIHDPFGRSSAAGAAAAAAANYPDERNESPSLDPEAEERAIREKGFFLHPSPATTPREAEPRLLPLFPVSSPRVSGSSSH
ncbi:VQ motif-containing protein 4 [Syzygium oleosum]|uniref:VQ motif-containing protein 4 n=1 Tax=Syzygium oleosum TaxID=219896 RepID=UPI0024BA955E|nr:VQ motif-containing protein 4 [Syzygium oleosum]